MRKAIDTAPRNGVFVILEDDARGIYAVARWSAEAAEWLDEEGTPAQLSATHWHPPQYLDEGSTPSQLNATHWHPPQNPLTPVDEIGSLSDPRMSSAWRASGSMTAHPQLAAKRGRSRNAWAGLFCNARRGCGKILSAVAGIGGWIVRKRRSIVTMTACLLGGAVIGPLLYRGDLGKWLPPRTAALENDTGLKQALRQEQERATKLASDATAARHEAESQAALFRQAGEAASREKEAGDRTIVQLRQELQLELAKAEKLAGQLAEAQRDSAVQTALASKAIDEAARAEAAKQADVRTLEQLALKQERDKAEKLRVELAAARREAESQAEISRSASAQATQMKEVGARATDELRQALRQAQDKAEKLAGELAATKQEVEEQATAARSASDEARRAAEGSKRSADEQSQVLREAQGEAEKLATELAAARREVQSQVSVASAARDHAKSVEEAAERSADEQRRALQQERDKTGELAAELAEARSRLQAQAKAKAAEEVVREEQLAALQRELHTAKAEAVAARESLEAENTRTQRVEQQLASVHERTADRGGGSPAAASSIVGQPSIAVPEPMRAPAEDTVQPSNSVTQLPASVEQTIPQVVRLMARANLLLDQGNIGAARNMLDRAAEMGSAEAVFWLAETYDPLLLSAWKTFGTQSDIAKARELYGKALAGGVSQAKLRLEALQQ